MFQSILNVVKSVFEFFTAKKNNANETRREAEKDLKKKQEDLDARKAANFKACEQGDLEHVNAAVALSTGFSLVIVFGLLMTVCGCLAEKKVVYVAADRQIELCENSRGIECYAVPKVVMAEMLNQIEELKDLRGELKVEQRVK